MFSPVIFCVSMMLTSLGSCYNSSWPKEIVVVRRRSGLTHKEYLYYHTLVHGAKAWNAPRDNSFPEKYVIDYVFDSVYGANDSVPNQIYVGRDDVAELYSSTATTFLAPPPTNYVQTVIGPDGYNFNDLGVAFSMVAYETSIKISSVCSSTAAGPPVLAFYWAAASSAPASNTTFAANLAKALTDSLPSNTVSAASIHVTVPGTDSRLYFGGFGMPTINAVVKLWLCDTDASVSKIRARQTSLNSSSLSLDIDKSFMVFSREVVIYDSATPFDIARLTGSLQHATSY